MSQSEFAKRDCLRAQSIVAIILLLSPLVPTHVALGSETAWTVYAARISSVNAWHDLATDPNNAEFVDAYIAVAALSRDLRRYREERLSIQVEAQAAYNFGDQDRWELNFAAGPRWHTFPWNDVVATTAAFGLGLSMASEIPDIEVKLEGASERLLIYWVAEITLARPHSPLSVSLRLHHRSPAFGLLGDDGGMNALGVGLRRAF
jgi:hypothetical protein